MADSPDLAEWLEAIDEPCRQLALIADRRMHAAAELARMHDETITINGFPEVSKITGNVRTSEDTTRYLADTDAWLNVVNKLCTGDDVIKAVLANAKVCTEAIEALHLLTDAFRGKGQYTQAVAWCELEKTQAWINSVQDDHSWADRAGY